MKKNIKQALAFQQQPTTELFRQETSGIIYELKENINIGTETADYLKSNLDICEALLATLDKLKNYFDYVFLTLEKDEEQMIWLYIYVNYEPQEALERLWEFDNDWWLTYKKTTANKLCIDVVPL